ncbi:MAG: glycoside hydrolase family 3 C-terminal domain-containing protein [Treponema sp.]|jgi:beta-glucosidase|nr:glycoside hydrolase family 3 C-terminal domain-containing protein [Treponema sp.]
MDTREEAAALTAKMTLDEKVKLLTGKDFWRLNGVERLGLASVMVTDGPHGLRKQISRSDHLGLAESVPSTCFPTACGAACSFDGELIYKMGEALGEECRKEEVAAILGPGVNIKRSPICGRNFEYLSEDPLLSGRLAAALIRGIQSRGVGTSLKHFAGNNQEKRRMTTDSVIDERALREIYLKAFEIAVKQGKPWTVMSAYNKLNGTYCGENPVLLTDILRKDWGFEGMVISDWGALSKGLESFAAGLDLEMPGTGNGYEEQVKRAVQEKRFSIEKLDEAVERITALILKAEEGKKVPFTCDMKAHLDLAARIVEESAVLLKNDEIAPGNPMLPGRAEEQIAVIGAFAKHPRYQGAGSSKINPVALDCAWDAFLEAGCKAEYAPGYSLEDDLIRPELLTEAESAAAGKDRVYIFAGLPDAYESEGFDRENMLLPAAHVELIKRVSAVNSNTGVVLLAGSPVDLSWEAEVKAILLACLPGCQGGRGIVNLLLGKANPSGKLAETFPLHERDVPCAAPSGQIYPCEGKIVQYRESIYVGYRYYNTAKKQIRYPFGYGLSYSSFEYSNIALDKTTLRDGDTLRVSCGVKNTGNRPGKETVQLYISQENPAIYKSEAELKDFIKLSLEAGESKTAEFLLTHEAFQYYSAKKQKWAVENGVYEIRIASSSRKTELAATISLEYAEAEQEDYRASLPGYYNLEQEIPFSEQSFLAVYGRPLPEETPVRPYTIDSTIQEINGVFLGRLIGRVVDKNIAGFAQGDKSLELLTRKMMQDIPLKQLAFSGVPMRMIEGIVHLLNGHPVKALGKFLRKRGGKS